MESDIFNPSQTTQVVNQVEHLFVFGIIIKRDDWDPVVDLEGERVDGVVYEHNVIQVTVTDDPQVFDVVAFFGEHTVLPVESMLEQLMVGVNIV